ncbi:T9SS type A sorting domain-containing protein [Chryseobacterium sp. POL2]|uniref:T9SS type A sorting domain-containing protein n=1 Tax=Chryseobacterium sp. POL2 TaxID=2713414 RepID=UPI0013E160E2|nr:T9SS type A sorting domain-containing protein [Chryseobacterium sp. POL2]QIG89211.1 T9SS type A sorting domain-containing protein [Chryseobacterium sp. POL2]
MKTTYSKQRACMVLFVLTSVLFSAKTISALAGRLGFENDNRSTSSIIRNQNQQTFTKKIGIVDDYFSLKKSFGNSSMVKSSQLKILPAPQNGDFRTEPGSTASIYFASTSNWQVYGSGGWQAATVSPQSASWTPENIFIESGSYVDVAGGRMYKNIFISNNVFVYSGDTDPGLGIADGKSLEVISGTLSVNGNLTLGASSKLIVRSAGLLDLNNSEAQTALQPTSQFEIENGGIVNISKENTNIWNGIEIFHEDSNVNITAWGSGPLFSTASMISNYTVAGISAKFGNLNIETSSHWNQVFPSGTYQITHRDLKLKNTSTSSSIEMAINFDNLTVGRDLYIGGAGLVLGQSTNGDKTLTVKRNFIKNDAGSFILLAKAGNKKAFLNINGDFLLNGGVFNLSNNNSHPNTSKVNLGGNFKKVNTGAVNSYLVNSNIGSADTSFNFVGNPTNLTQTITATSNTTSNDFMYLYFYIKNSANVKLTKDWQLGTSAKLIVENAGILDFGLNGLTANNISRIENQTSQSFELMAGGKLIITSPEGIMTGGTYTGNVQIGGDATTRVFSGDATYHYVGRSNQVSGNALPNAVSAKKVIVELFTDAFTFQPNGLKRINSNGYLEIRKGTVLDNGTGSFSDGDLPSENGGLIMSGGRYRLQKIGFNPGLSGTYNLTGGIVEFNNANASSQNVRAPKLYNKIEVTGTNVWSTSGTISLRDQGSFTVKSNADFATNTQTIDGPVGTQSLIVESNAIFKTGDEDGFSGGTNTSVHNTIENISLANASTIEYSRGGNQIITNAPVTTSPIGANYAHLKISGSGIKTATGITKVNNLVSVVRGELKLSETADNLASNVLEAKQGLQNTGGIVRFENNAILMQDPTANNIGAINLERKATVPANQYNLWASPVVEQDLYALYGSPNSVMAGKVMEYITKTDTFKPVIAGTKSAKAKGYSAIGLASNAVKAIFSGVPNNAAFVFDVGNNVGQGDGYNLTGNPYPSNFDLDLFYTLNNTLLDVAKDNNAYFWDNTGNTDYNQYGSDYSGDNYATYNFSSKTGNQAPRFNNDVAAKKPISIIKSGQAFIVKLKSTTASLSFDNTMRTATSSAVYFKNEKPKRYWLELITPKNLIISTAVVYDEGAVNIYDKYDALANTSASDLFYSISSDAEPLSIQGRQDVDIRNDVIALGVKAYESGNYKIAFAEGDAIFADGQDIYLKDKLLNKIVKLNDGNYNFTLEKGFNLGRFEIIYKSDLVLNATDPTKNDFVVYKDEEDFIIKSDKNLGQVEVYDAVGRLIWTEWTNLKQLNITSSIFTKGIYIIKADRFGETRFKKIIK